MGFMNTLRTATPNVEEEAPDAENGCRIDDPELFVIWAEKEANRISQLSEADQIKSMEAFESRCAEFDRLPDKLKEHSLKRAKKPSETSLFERRIGPSWTVVLRDLEKPGLWVARKGGVVGNGSSQVEAVKDLETKIISDAREK